LIAARTSSRTTLSVTKSFERAFSAATAAGLIQWLSRREGVDKLLGVLAGTGANYYFVGGVVRDYLLGRPVESCSDVDLLVPWESGELTVALKDLPSAGETAFGNPRYRLAPGFHLDVFPPRTSWMHVLATPEDVLEHLDFTINAIAVSPVLEAVLSPHGAFADLHDGVLRPLHRTWLAAGVREQASLLRRAVVLQARLGLRLCDDDEAFARARSEVERASDDALGLTPEQRGELLRALDELGQRAVSSLDSSTSASASVL
jgi:tRNA nucleotidyltransferase/poly(A) polymerase